MAAINPEDLEKLKKFIDFVSANPLILNVPQLGFLKRFIEKFGGKVPEGEYQMPAGGKCPFGGDAKTETKTQPPPTQDDDAAEPVVEEESEESEVELDMEETSNVQQLLKPNVLYLEENPPTIVKKAKTKKPRGVTKKTNLGRKSSARGSTKKLQSKKETKNSQNLTSSAMNKNEDPLYTEPEVEIKMEIEGSCNEEGTSVKGNYELRSAHEPEKSHMQQDDKAYDFLSTEANDGDEELLVKYEPKDDDDDEEEYDGDDYEDGDSSSLEDYEDNEPLIKLSKRRGRPRQYSIVDDADKRPGLAVCRDNCKQKCTQKYTEDMRQQMCRQFWSLTKEEKVEFIRKHTKTKRYVRILKRNTKRMSGNNRCYYLDGIKNHAEDEEGEEVREEGNRQETDITRVCRTYFVSTLCLNNYLIKKALEGFTPPTAEMLGKPLVITNRGEEEQQENPDKSKENDCEIEQYLDPETGNLIKLNPKAEKQKPGEDKPKYKRKTLKTAEKRQRNPKPIKCAERCIYKCHTKFTEEERKQICDAFWSLDYKRRKDFVLARIEKREIETERAPEFRKTQRPPRAYHTRFFLKSPTSNENIRVCKHFMMATLSIVRTFITDAIDFADKNTGCYTGCDRRGLNVPPKRVPDDCMQIIKDHIASYPTWMPNKKSKIRCLHHTLSMKRMYDDYKKMCEERQMQFVGPTTYRKVFHTEFRLSFLCDPVPKRGIGLLKNNPNISHYTGIEPGGIWLNSQGEKLDLELQHPARSFMNISRTTKLKEGEATTSGHLAISESPSSSERPNCSTIFWNTESTNVTPNLSSSSTFGLYPNVSYGPWMDGILNSTNPLLGGQSTTAVIHREFRADSYENIPQPAHTSSSTGALFRKL
ncbi:uncharacterized protein isoform X5 [Musca autumnalis]|uniref:uncharacterized protein isoform X5 n=1 Tax=Musca autumnalis TaxID=221902 RepID=UPI003CEE2A16